MPIAADVNVGSRRRQAFSDGHHAYVGSALNSLFPRLRRHLRVDKPLRWHIDYLRQVASVVRIYYRLGTERIECETASRVAALDGAEAIPRFGSSDCRCASHLFRLPTGTELELGPGWVALDVDERDPLSALA